MKALAHIILGGLTLVYKSGFLSALGHDHEIQAPIEITELKVVI